MNDFRKALTLAVKMPVLVPGALVGLGVVTQFVPILALGVGWILLKGITGNLYGSDFPDDVTSRQWAVLTAIAATVLVGLWLLTSRCTPGSPCRLF